MSYQHIEVTSDGHVARLRMNRPDKANALHYEHLGEIEDALLAMRDDAAIRVVIVSGNGRALLVRSRSDR